MHAPRQHLTAVPAAPGATALPPHRPGRARPSTRWSLPVAPSADTVRGRVLAVTDRCWQCRTKVRAIVGALVDPAQSPDGSGFRPLDDVADRIAETVDPRTLAGRRIGAIKHRESPGVEGGYIGNGCVECDALLGRFALEDLLNEHLVNGGTYAQLDVGVTVDLPIAAPGRLRAIV